MPSGGAFNLARFANALGLKGIDAQPSLEMRSVTPVVVAGDASAIVPAFVPPLALAGSEILAVAGERPMVQVECRAPGGLSVVAGRFNAITVVNWRFAVGAASFAALAGTAVNMNMGPTPIESVVTFGTLPANVLPATSPALTTVARGPLLLDDLIFLNHGQFLFVDGVVVNTLTMFHVVLMEHTPANV